ncbi:hypothetical protein ACFS4T_15470 [Pseudomonas lini]
MSCYSRKNPARLSGKKHPELIRSDKAAHRLGIGAHRIAIPLHSRGTLRERKDVISDEITASLRIVQTGPDRLVLCLQYPVDPDSELTPPRPKH